MQAPPKLSPLTPRLAIAQLGEHLTAESCNNQMDPGSIPGGRTSTQSRRGKKLLWLRYHGANLATANAKQVANKPWNPVISEDNLGRTRPGMACTMVPSLAKDLSILAKQC